MSRFASLSTGTGVALGASAVAVIAATAYFSGVFTPAPEAEQAPAAALQQPPTIQQTPSLQEVPVTQAPSDPPAVVAELSKPDITQQKPDLALSTGPRFDVVRVEKDGFAMIAGAAQAGDSVQVRLDDTIVAEVEAGSDGKFASFVTLPESAVPRVLTLEVAGAAAGGEQVIVTPTLSAPVIESTAPVLAAPSVAPAPAPEAPVTVVEPAPPTPDATPSIATAEPSQEITPPPEPEQVARAAPAPVAPTVLLATEQGVRVLQSPSAPRPDAMTALLDAISYDAAGEVALAGRASGDFIRVYLDNAPVTTSRIREDGQWSADLPAVDTGIYTLRVDEVNAQGDVTARVETPFKREAAEVLTAASEPDKAVQAITVQPGATLWAIARDRYGSGVLYTRVFQANAGLIRDPDLIYPGQVFSIPD